MPLRSRTFSGDQALEACLINDSAHLTRGARGEPVAKIQAVVMFLDDALIDQGELASKTYGPSTAAAILAYKRKRNIVNQAYETQADDIVGRMTIKALDDELMLEQVDHTPPGPRTECTVDSSVTAPSASLSPQIDVQLNLSRAIARKRPVPPFIFPLRRS